MPKIERKLVKVNKPLGKYKPGDEVKVVFKDGIAMDRFWRDRVYDAITVGDNCIEFVKPPKEAKK